MFVFKRSAVAVLAPLALLLAVVLWSNGSTQPALASEAAEVEPAATVAQQADQPGQNDS
jgi:uncharacterized SAM-binding protein YcdF (DUF218 family)